MPTNFGMGNRTRATGRRGQLTGTRPQACMPGCQESKCRVSAKDILDRRGQASCDPRVILFTWELFNLGGA